MISEQTRKDGLLTTILLHGFLILVTLLTLYPVLGVIRSAFDEQAGLSTSLSLLPEGFTFSHFEELLYERSADGTLVFAQHLWNSLIVSIATTIVGIFLACTAAYAFSRFQFTGGKRSLRLFWECRCQRAREHGRA